MFKKDRITDLYKEKKMKLIVRPESPRKATNDFEIYSPIRESDKLDEMFRVYKFLSNHNSKSKKAIFEVSYCNYHEKEYQSQINAAVADFHDFLSYCNLSFTSWTETETLNTYNKTSWFKDKRIIIKTAVTSFPDKSSTILYDEMLNRLMDREFTKRFEQTKVFSDLDAFLKKLFEDNESPIYIRITTQSINVAWSYDSSIEDCYDKNFEFRLYGYKSLTTVQQASLCVLIKGMFANKQYELDWRHGTFLTALKQTKNVPLPLKEW